MKIKDAAKDFVELLNPKDKALIATFDSQLKVLNPFTSSRSDLKDAIDKVQTAVQDGTVLNYAIQQTVQKTFSNAEGRKVVIVLSDGKDFGSSVSQSELLGILEESDVLIYSIHYKTGSGTENLVISSDGKVKEAEKLKLDTAAQLRQGQGLPWRRGRHDRPGRDRRAGSTRASPARRPDGTADRAGSRPLARQLLMAA